MPHTIWELEGEECAVLGTCQGPVTPLVLFWSRPKHVLVDSLCSVRVFKLFSRSIRYNNNEGIDDYYYDNDDEEDDNSDG